MGFVDLLVLLSHLNHTYRSFSTTLSTCNTSEYFPTPLYCLRQFPSTPSHCLPHVVFPFHVPPLSRFHQVLAGLFIWNLTLPIPKAIKWYASCLSILKEMQNLPSQGISYFARTQSTQPSSFLDGINTPKTPRILQSFSIKIRQIQVPFAHHCFLSSNTRHASSKWFSHKLDPFLTLS